MRTGDVELIVDADVGVLQLGLRDDLTVAQDVDKAKVVHGHESRLGNLLRDDR